MSFTVLATRAQEKTVEIDVHVPADCPFLRGHFPRHPILPAVALLNLVVRLGAAHTGLGTAPRTLRGLRLRGSVLPDTSFCVRLHPKEAELVFSVTTGEGDRKVTGAQGCFGYDSVDPAPPLTDGFGRPVPRAESLGQPALPHAGPALLVREVLARDSDGVLCRARIPPDSPFRPQVRPGEKVLVPALLAIELAAQASAAHNEQDPGGGSAAAAAGRGLLVNVRRAWFGGADFDPDQNLLVEARPISLAPPLRNFAAQVRSRDGVLLGAAQLGTWVPTDS